MEMGKEIRRLRNNRGLTQEALAAALNVTAQTVSKWECGTSVPDVQMLPELAVYFGVSIDQLFAMSPEQQMDRIENHIYARGLFDEAEQRQLEQQLKSFAEKPAYEGPSCCWPSSTTTRPISTACWPWRTEKKPRKRPTTATRSASSATPGAAISPTGASATTTPSSIG